MKLQQHVGSVAVDEEESEFPHGGKETLTPLEKRLIKEQAQKDVLFDEVGLECKTLGESQPPCQSLVRMRGWACV